MISSRPRHLLAAWLAVAAVLMAALAPAVSRMLAAGTSAVNVPVMAQQALHPGEHGEHHDHSAHDSSSLVVTTADSAHDRQTPSGHDLHVEHCPFCVTHAGSFGLVPSLPLVFSASSVAAFFPALFFLAPRPLFIWTSAQPRAPPLVFSTL